MPLFTLYSFSGECIRVARDSGCHQMKYQAWRHEAAMAGITCKHLGGPPTEPITNGVYIILRSAPRSPSFIEQDSSLSPSNAHKNPDVPGVLPPHVHLKLRQVNLGCKRWPRPCARLHQRKDTTKKNAIVSIQRAG